jgi:hypothetical protein
MALASYQEDITERQHANGARGYIDQFSFPVPTYEARARSPISKKIVVRAALAEALDLRNLQRRFARKWTEPNSSVRVVMTPQRAVIVQTIKRRMPAYMPSPPLEPPTWSARRLAGSGKNRCQA